MHGAGEIVGIEQKSILGEVHDYYVMQLSVSSMKVMLPTNNTETIGIRDIVSENTANDIINYFHTCEEEPDGNWNKRYRENIDKIRSGNPFEVARVAKTLVMRDRKKSLSTAERKMLTNAKNVLISELVLAKNTTAENVEYLLMNDI